MSNRNSFVMELHYLIGFIEEPKNKKLKKKEPFIARSLECIIPPIGGSSPREAAEKLAKLLSEHLNSCYEKKTVPFYPNIYEFEKFGKYCAEKGFPKKLCDIDLGRAFERNPLHA